MDFAHYADDAVQAAEDLVNTFEVVTQREDMPDAEALRAFLAAHDFRVPDRIPDRDLDAVRRLRTRLRAAFEASDEAATVEMLNQLLSDVGALPQVTNHDGHPWHLHYVAADAPVADHLAAISAMGLASVIVTHGWDRLGVCSADDCRDVFVNTSRNRSRRYCGDTCSSRMNVAKYRARHKHHA